MKTLRPPLMLAPDNIPTEVVAALEVLLKDAKQGKLIGLALTAIYTRPTRRFIAKAIGEAERSVVFTIGTLIVLVARLLRKAFKEEY